MTTDKPTFNRFVEGPNACNLKIEGLPAKATVYDIEHYFRKFGNILSVDKETGTGRISFADEYHAKAALEAYSKSNELGIRVSYLYGSNRRIFDDEYEEINMDGTKTEKKNDTVCLYVELTRVC